MSERDDQDIVVLPGLEAVRRRPALYVGDVDDGTGMHRLLWALVDRAVSEHLDGSAAQIRVEMAGDAASVEDDGAGILTESIPREAGAMALEVVLTRLFCGGHFAGAALDRWHRSRYGLGLAVTNALSERLAVEVCRGGRTYQQRYAMGAPCGPMRDVGPATRTGTRVTFTPDPAIFRRRAWDLAAIGRRLRETAALCPGLTTIAQDETYRSPGGLADHAVYLAGDARRWHEPLRLRGARGEITVDAALLWTDGPGVMRGFVNGEPVDDGDHVRGMQDGIGRARARVATRAGDVRPIALVHVILPDARLRRDADLESRRVRDAVRRIVDVALARELVRVGL